MFVAVGQRTACCAAVNVISQLVVIRHCVTAIDDVKMMVI